jgi:hypothetical protein
VLWIIKPSDVEGLYFPAYVSDTQNNAVSRLATQIRFYKFSAERYRGHWSIGGGGAGRASCAPVFDFGRRSWGIAHNRDKSAKPVIPKLVEFGGQCRSASSKDDQFLDLHPPKLIQHGESTRPGRKANSCFNTTTVQEINW